jgi:hypothetical protein
VVGRGAVCGVWGAGRVERGVRGVLYGAACWCELWGVWLVPHHWPGPQPVLKI